MTAGPPGRERGISTAGVLGIAAAAGLVPLNSTMIAVALPKIATDFEISTGRASILVTAYLVAMLVGQPVAGRLGDRFGIRRTVHTALIGLMVCSFGAALSTSFGTLAIARVAQAVFAAALGPGVQALLRDATRPSDRGRSFGLMGSVLGVGAASGPVVGGLLTQAFGWQAIFLVNVPVAAAALLVSIRIGAQVPDATTDVEPSPAVAHSRIVNPVFVAAFAVQALTTLAQYALLLLTPIILDARGWESGAVGAVLSALTVGMILMGPVGGRMGDRVGRRLPAQIGLAVGVASVAVLFTAGPTILPLLLVAGLAVFGFGLGAAVPNLQIAALESVPPERTGAAAGVLSMSRYVGSITTSVAVSIFVASDAEGTRIVLGAAAVAMIASVIAARGLPRHETWTMSGQLTAERGNLS